MVKIPIYSVVYYIQGDIMFKRHLMLALLFVLPTALHATNYSIGTGGQSGIYYPFGGALAKVWSEHVPNVNATAEVTAASVENTIKVVRGDMIAGIAMGNVVLDAYHGEGKVPRLKCQYVRCLLCTQTWCMPSR